MIDETITHKERSDLKERLRLQYIAITDFKERFLFWQEHNLDLRYRILFGKLISRIDEKIDSGFYNRIEPQIKESETRKNKGYSKESTIKKIKYLNDYEDEKKGIIRPIPISNEEKTFVAEYWIKVSQKVYKNAPMPILTFEDYKARLLTELSQLESLNDKVDALKEELNIMETYLKSFEKYGNYYNMILLKEPKRYLDKYKKREVNNDSEFEKIKLTGLIEKMLRKNKIDYLTLYYQNEYCLLKQDSNFYNHIALFLSPMQYQKHLKNELHELQLQQSIVSSNLLPKNNSSSSSPKENIQRDTNLQKPYLQYFNIEKKEIFTELLKEEFKYERGKLIRLLIDTLIQKNYLLLGDRDYKNFLIEMKKYFGRDIGSYQSIKDYKYNKNYEKDFANINKRLELVINEWKR